MKSIGNRSHWNKSRIRKASVQGITGLFIYSLLIGLAFVFLYPFLYMIFTSFKTQADLNDISVKWILTEIRWENYATAFRALQYTTRLPNTVFVVLLSVVGHILSCSFVGYGFARFNFRFKGFWLALLLLAIIIPTETIIVPLYIFFSRIGFTGSYLPIIVPSFVGFGLRGAFYVFIFRQFFLSLPKALEEAAAVDGAGPIRTFFSIALPNARSSALITLVLGVVWHWNDTSEPLIYIEDQARFLLPQMLPVLYQMISADSITDQLLDHSAEIFNNAVVMAATVLVIAPLIIFYLSVQSKFMMSIERSGITG